ncbi:MULTISPECIES: hypothetical protein [unclassified Saccharicrinis]|uniref:hypothetical protein n=1 Tax=unclassified Saccharicrinis TaxID=2646859 RepID=UPI003D32A3D6
MKLSKILTLLLLMFFTLHSSAFSRTVNSLKELLPYLDDDHVNVVLKPGTYSITTEDIKGGTYGTSDCEDRAKILLLFSGSNSTYDFTGVTLNIETAVFNCFGKYRVHEVVVTGNNNVLKNLTMVDVGSVYDGPNKGALGVCMDGKDNLIEGFHMTVKGSYPYGYGDAFGKGGKNNMINHRKHSAFLVRGLRNHAKNCTIIHRSYGHCMFMQAASYPTIEGCVIEGAVRKTDDMLAETSGPAFDIDFMTTWGYRLPAGYMLSLGEAGIRAYNGGTTIIDGEIIKRGTDNPTILNCTIKNMRTGVTVAHATGKKYVEGCIVIGCENGYSLGNGDVVNCKADCAYGPVYASTYGNDKGYHADITIIPAENGYYNGSGSVAYIGGSGHKITLKGSSEAVENGLRIMVGGDKGNIRLLNGNFPHQNNFKGADFELNNLTDYPVYLSPKSSGVKVKSKGKVIDEGIGNQIK